jgi:hypothetical protein
MNTPTPLSKKKHFTPLFAFGSAFLLSNLSPQAHAAPMTELDADLNLVEAFIERKAQFDFKKEMSFQLKLIKSKYKSQPETLAKIDIKINYAQQRTTTPRKIIEEYDVNKKSFEDIFLFFVDTAANAKDANGEAKPDTKGLGIAGKKYFTSKYKNSLKLDHPYFDQIKKTAVAYNKQLKKDDPTASKAFAKWWKEDLKGGPLVEETGVTQAIFQDTAALLDDAYKIYSGQKQGKINTADIKAQIKLVKDLEWQQSNDEIDHWFLRAASEAARGMALIGEGDAALKWMGHYYVKFDILDKSVKEYAKEKKDPSIVNGSAMANFLYSKGCIYWAKAIAASKSGKKQAAQDFLVSKNTKSAAVNFYLLAARYPRSSAGIKTIFNYDSVWDLYKKVGGSKDKKDLPISKDIMMKAFYGEKEYQKAMNIADKALPDLKKAGEIGELLWFSMGAAVLSDDFKRAEKYFSEIESKFSKSKQYKEQFYDRAKGYRKSAYTKRKTALEEELAKKEDAKLRKILDVLNTIKLSDPNNPGEALIAIVEDLKVVLKVTDSKTRAAKAKEVIAQLDAYIKRFPNAPQVISAFSIKGQIAEVAKEYQTAIKSYKEFLKRSSPVEIKDHVKKAEAFYHIAYNRLKLNQIEGPDGLIASIKVYKDYLKKVDFSEAEKKQQDLLATFNAGLDIWMIDLDFAKVKPVITEFKKIKSRTDAASEANKKALVIKLQKMGGKVAERYNTWIQNNDKDRQVPNILAKIGGLYQDCEMPREAKAIFSRLVEDFPGHPVIAQTKLRIVLANHQNKRIGDAAKAALDLDIENLPEGTQLYLVNLFLYSSVPDERQLRQEEFKMACQVLIRTWDAITKKVKDANKKHQYTFYAGRAHFLLGDKGKAGELFDIIKNENPNSPYNNDISFLDVDIMIEQAKFSEADKIIADLQNRVKAYGTALQVAKVMMLSGKLGFAARVLTPKDAAIAFIKKGLAQCFLVRNTQFNPNTPQDELREVLEQALFYEAMSNALLGKEKEFKALRDQFNKEFGASPLRRQLQNPPAKL